MSHTLKAKLAAPAVWEWLSDTRQAQILHLFDHACNLVNERGDVLSLVSEEIGAGPFHAVLPNWFVVSDLSAYVSDELPATNVAVSPGNVQVGGWQVDISPAVRWEPRVDWERLRAHTAVWQPHIPTTQTTVQQYRAQLGLDTAVWQPPLQAGLDLLLVGIAQAETAVMQAGTAQLAGLGPGLTPAGDDVLMGVMLGLWATKAEEEVRPLAAVMVETAVPLTTTLSAAWLRAAGRGEAGWLWHEFANRLVVSGNRWEETAARILATGHSSGADALWGFLSVNRGL